MHPVRVRARENVDHEMKPTPLERFWAVVHRSAKIATGVWLGGLVLYVACGAVFRWLAPFNLADPLLVVNQDPILYFLVAGAGLFVSISMVGRVFSVMLEQRNREEDIVLLVLLAAIVVGFGMSAFYLSIRIFSGIVVG